jgi:hypothetical protein
MRVGPRLKLSFEERANSHPACVCEVFAQKLVEQTALDVAGIPRKQSAVESLSHFFEQEWEEDGLEVSGHLLQRESLVRFHLRT